jgi:hypothetical protein
VIPRKTPWRNIFSLAGRVFLSIRVKKEDEKEEAEEAEEDEGRAFS